MHVLYVLNFNSQNIYTKKYMEPMKVQWRKGMKTGWYKQLC